ncbi:MAG: energy transducer TonB [Prevotella nanceiensis]|nr:energy transducer TonB [Hoylesella nanceiensis]
MNKNIFILILFALALPVAMFSADSKSHTRAELQRDVMQWVHSLVVSNCENKSEQSVLYSANPLNMQAECHLVTQDGKEKNTNVDDELPSFPGGDAKLREWIKKNMKYPSYAKKNGIEGQVLVVFIVEKDGSISNAEVSWGVDPSLDQEALRIVNKMPKWKPGTQNGVAMRVKYRLPITFMLKK